MFHSPLHRSYLKFQLELHRPLFLQTQELLSQKKKDLKDSARHDQLRALEWCHSHLASILRNLKYKRTS